MELLSMKLSATATQVAAADAADQTLKTLSDASEVARIPEYAVFHKAAGTAYSAYSGDLEIKDEDGGVWFKVPASFLSSASESARAVRGEASAFTGGNKTIKLAATGTITAGTGSPGLTITIFYRNVVLK